MSEVSVSDLVLLVIMSECRDVLELVYHLFILFFISLSLIIIGTASEDICRILMMYVFIYFLCHGMRGQYQSRRIDCHVC